MLDIQDPLDQMVHLDSKDNQEKRELMEILDHQELLD